MAATPSSRTAQGNDQTQMSKYKVLVDDNFHYMEEDARTELGTYDSVEEALAACRNIVDAWLAANYKPGMSAKELIEQYRSFGDDPFIVGLPGVPEQVKFSAWDYAAERAQAMCAGR
jgi:hypothetical protein